MFALAAVTAVARFAIFRSCDLPFASHIYMYAYMYMKIIGYIQFSFISSPSCIFICVQFAVPHASECWKYTYEVCNKLKLCNRNMYDV